MTGYFQILAQEIYKILFLVIPILVSVAMIVWLDRRVWGLVQKRKGPNVVGVFGLLQPLADGVKLFTKETILPSHANIAIFIISPIAALTLALLSWAVIPYSDGYVIADINVGMLYLFAVSSISVYAILMSG